MPAFVSAANGYRVVGIAEMAVSNQSGVILATHSLGCCLGIVLYDTNARVGGMMHVMLPKSNMNPIKAASHPSMFLDSGIPALIKAALDLGASVPNIKLFAAGGAQMLDSSGFFSVGQSNCEMLDPICRQHGVQIHGKMLGGQESCSIFLQIASGDVWVKLSGQPQQVFLCKNSTTT